ncbi:helix-turn-helix transcriptional regulator [Fictibacillus aquaticus]|nr:helix-turn-helix transcriptional regulator [Fictibacillus aquaticus]
MELTCRLEEILRVRGLKKGFVAAKANIGVSTMSLLVQGKQLPSLPVAFKIAEVLELRIEDIWIKKN